MIRMHAIASGLKASDFKKHQKIFERALREEGKEIRTLYQKTTETWEHQIVFNTETHATPERVWTAVWTVNKPYWFVHEGIAVMHAILSGPKDPAGRWIPKTEPRVIGSTAGSGRVIRIRSDYQGKLYKPRKFTFAIMEERQDKFKARMEQAMQDVAAGP